MSAALFAKVVDLVDSARAQADGSTAQAELDEIRDRLHEPLRVAIAGKSKAGKSTLLNALVGEVLAPTDEGECTKVITWYQHGIGYRATLEPVDGPPRPTALDRSEDGANVDLGGLDASQIARIVVEWPSPALASMTLIDTPGVGSLSGVGLRSIEFLAPADERPSPADAVVYLTRHVHAGDVRFLEAFHDDTSARATPVNAIAVLSRADEIGGGRSDSLESAVRIAERYRTNPTFRRFCHTVVPVAGLLAQASATLTEAEYRALGRLAELSDDDIDPLLLSAERLVDEDVVAPIGPAERRHLYDRLGLFGVRLGRDLLRERTATSARQLAEELRRRSGLDELRRLLATSFTGRRDLLKARSAMLATADVLLRHRLPAGSKLSADLERIQSSAHELAELRILTGLRSGAVPLTPDEAAEVERLLDPTLDPVARLGLDDASPADVKTAVVAGVERWRARAESPLSSPVVIEACQVVGRSLEGMLVAT